MARHLSVDELVRVLLKEHKEVRALMAELENTLEEGPKKVAEGMLKINDYLKQHIVDEEAVVLKHLLNTYGKENCEEEIKVMQQHRIIHGLLNEGVTLSHSSAISSRFKEVKEVLEDHFKKEEKIFPKVLKTIR